MRKYYFFVLLCVFESAAQDVAEPEKYEPRAEPRGENRRIPAPRLRSEPMFGCLATPGSADGKGGLSSYIFCIINKKTPPWNNPDGA
jgi:hypothetical protein